MVAGNRALYEDRITCVAFREDETERLRWIDGKRLSDIRIEDA